MKHFGCLQEILPPPQTATAAGFEQVPAVKEYFARVKTMPRSLPTFCRDVYLYMTGSKKHSSQFCDLEFRSQFSLLAPLFYSNVTAVTILSAETMRGSEISRQVQCYEQQFQWGHLFLAKLIYETHIVTLSC